MRDVDAAVLARHPELPSLRLVLDDDALSEALAALGGAAVDVHRLRLKPGTSVRAVARGRGALGGWWLVHGYGPDAFEDKAAKDVQHARSLGLRAQVLPGQRAVLLPGWADRRIRGLGALAGRAARPTHPDQPVHCLSHNPSRRWVGRVGTPDGPGGQRVLRLVAGGAPVQVPWQPGRPWRPQDGTGVVAGALAAGLREPAGNAGDGRVDPVPHLARALREAAASVAAVDPVLGARARAAAGACAGALRGSPLAPAHGDLSPDQVVVADAGPEVGGGTGAAGAAVVAVVDWDRRGLWPVGWDAASWTASQLAAGAGGTGGQPLPGPDPAGAVLAAAALLRAPEPFRHRRPGWELLTSALVAVAERELAPVRACSPA